jgi:selenocysteine lyase/cysteine desulfurase
MDIANKRADFPALGNHIYLNTAGIGLTPQPVTEEVQRLFGEWSAQGATTPTFREEIQRLVGAAHSRAARLFAADVDELAFTGRVAESLHIVVDGLPWRAGDEIIVSDEEVLYMPIYRLAKDYGVVIKRMRLDHCREEFLNRFDDLLTSRTRFVWLSDTTNKSGVHIPTRELCTLAHAKGVLVMFDGAQTAGQLPVNLHEMGCDFYAITGYKWLLGPYGCGLCYIRKELIPQVRALRIGHGTLDHGAFDYTEADGAMRYDFGVRNLVLRAGFGKTLEYLEGIGFEAISSRVAALRHYLIEGLDRLPGVHIGSPRNPEMGSGIVCVSLEGKKPAEIVAKAWEAGIVIVPLETAQDRPDLHGVRVSPNFYNTKEDLDYLLETLTDMAL